MEESRPTSHPNLPSDNRDDVDDDGVDLEDDDDVDLWIILVNR